MILRFLKERTVAELRRSIRENLDLYRTGSFDNLVTDPSLSFESKIEYDEATLAKLKDPKGTELFETDNCAIAYSALDDVSPYEAADERLWVMLSHTTMLKHGRARWPIPKKEDEAVNHIETHFFAQLNGSLKGTMLVRAYGGWVICVRALKG